MAKEVQINNPSENVPSFIPQDVFNVHVFRSCERIAEIMSKSRLVPDHLHGKQADCFIIVQQAYRWKMDPFAVAQCTSIVKGKLCYEGKLVAAVLEALAGIRLNYMHNGSGLDRSVTVSGRRKGDAEDCKLTICVKDVQTENAHWKKNPDQMLSYRGTRDWARRYSPAALLGIYTIDEMELEDVTPQNQQLKKAFISNGVVVEGTQNLSEKKDPLQKMLTTAVEVESGTNPT